MTPEETRAYSKGYAAGKKRQERDISNETLRRRQAVLWNRAFLALLPHALEHGPDWKIGGENCATTEMRMKLAGMWANRALEYHLKDQS